MKENEDMKNVVSVKYGDVRLIGFLTGAEEKNSLLAETELYEMVSVYLPMSYQIGGFTVYVPREMVETIDMTVEDAMRLVLTAGLSQGAGHNKDT